MSGYTYSECEPALLHEVLALIRNVFMEYEAPEYAPEGIEEFMRFIEPGAIAQRMVNGSMRLWVCRNKDAQGAVVGALGARFGHINLLFVSGAHHRRGIARRLFGELLTAQNPPSVTVNSSPYAVEAYRRLGFAPAGSGQTVNGIRFFPMKWVKK